MTPALLLVGATDDGAGAPSDRRPEIRLTDLDRAIGRNASRLLEEGRRIFRFDTFGDEAFWGDTLKLHQAVGGAGGAVGGVGTCTPGPAGAR